MGNNSNWQVQAPSINLYALDDMYKNRNIIPTGENTLVDMLQNAWNTGKKALQEDFKNNVIGNTDPTDITKAKAQGMTTNQYLQNQASNKGWLMDYIANPLSNLEVQTAANALDKDELSKYKDYLNQQTYDEFVTDRTGATTDAVAKIQKALLARPVSERSSLQHDALFNLGRGVAERLINPNDTLLMELNKQLVLSGKQPILGEDIMRSPDRLLQALRGMDRSEGTKLYDTVAAREGFNSLFTKGPNEAKSRADIIFGTDDRFTKAVQYTREAKQVADAFKAQFPNLANLTPEIYDTWTKNYITSIGLDPNSELAKNALVGPDAMVKQYVNEQYLAMLQNYFNLLNGKKADTVTLSAKNKAQQDLYNFNLKWGKWLDPSTTNLYNHFRETDNMGAELNNALTLQRGIETVSNLGKALTEPVSNRLISNYKTDPRVSQIFNEFKGKLKQIVKEDPEFKGLNISDDDYDKVTYHFIEQVYTPTSQLGEKALMAGIDLNNPAGDNISKFNNTFNPDTFSGLNEIQMNPKYALLLLGMQRAQNKR